MSKILIQISIGELLDKLSILDIKRRKIQDSNKLNYIQNEYDIIYKQSILFLESDEIKNLYTEILKVNEELWSIEDSIREMEKNKTFSDNFISLARNVYLKNDKRFSIKNQINIISNSEIQEQKSYKKY